ncbi:MAG: hypothetical protein Q9204_004351 [Flavoplaca sp. TL-2023a]
MNAPCRAVRSYEQRPAYQPTDPIAFIKLQQLRCVRSGDADLGPEVRLCSLCTEVALGEPLLDHDGGATEFKIAFYELPCEHLRWLVKNQGSVYSIVFADKGPSCSCALKKPSIKPDLSFILGVLDHRKEPDMSWIKGFYNGKRKKPASLRASSKIELLPPIRETKELEPATPAKEAPVVARPGDRRLVRPSPEFEVSGYPVATQLQRTPATHQQGTQLEAIPDTLSEPPFDEEENSSVMSAQVQKKHKLWSWANSPNKPLPDQSFEEWLEEEEEQQPRKKLRLSF